MGFLVSLVLDFRERKCVWFTAKSSPLRLTEAPSMVGPIKLMTGNLSATEVADTVELWTAPRTVAAARIAREIAVFIAMFSQDGSVSSCLCQSECGVVCGVDESERKERINGRLGKGKIYERRVE